MIVFKTNKCYSLNSCFPDINYTHLDDSEVFVVDETLPENKELVSKIIKHSPFIDFVIENGKLVDVTPLTKPEPAPQPAPEPSIAELQEQQLAQAEAIAAIFERLEGGA